MAEETEGIKASHRWRRFFRIGPPALLTSFTDALTITVLTDLIVYRTCLVSLNINATDCFMLRNNSGSQEAVDLETKVEPYASLIVMTNFSVKTILPAVISVFLGPWSDRAGRKPIILAVTSGATIMFIALALICNWNISPWYLVLATIPGNIVGGLWTARLAFVCYISDTTVGENKLSQMSLLEASISGGNILGGIVGSLIYHNYGYTQTFVTAAVCSTFTFVYTYFCVPETVKNTSKESIRGLFKISFVIDLFVSFFMKREGFRRVIVWLSMFVITLIAVVRKGDLTVSFLFTRARLGWDVQHYSYFHAAENVLRIVGLCAVSIPGRFSGVSDTMFAFVSFVSALGGSIAKSLSWKSWHVYVSGSIGILSGMTLPVMRSMISNFVPAQDVGKFFSLAALFEILGASCGPALYTMTYSNYLPPIYPSPVFMLSVSFYTASLICVACIGVSIRNRRKEPTYIPAAQEEELR